MRSSLLAAGAAVILTLSACGSDSKSDSASDSTDAPASADSVAETDGGATDTTVAGGDTDETTADSIPVDTDFSGEGSDAFCAVAKQFDENDPTSGLFDSTDPDQLKADWATAQGLVEDLVAEAPDEIKSDFETLLQGFKDIGDIYEKYDWDIQKLSEAAATDPEVQAIGQNADADAASERVDAYVEQVCGIDTSGTDASTDTTG